MLTENDISDTTFKVGFRYSNISFKQTLQTAVLFLFYMIVEEYF